MSECKVSVRYIPKSMSDSELTQLFSKVGNVKYCKLMKNEFTGENSGYGLIDFDSSLAAQSAVNKFNGFKIGYKTLQVSLFRSSENVKTPNLLIKNLPFWITDVTLYKEFSNFGCVLRCKVFKNSVTCYGYVLYQDIATAEKAKAEMEGKKWPNDPCSNALFIKYAQPPVDKCNIVNNYGNTSTKNAYVVPQQLYYVNTLPYILPQTYGSWNNTNNIIQNQSYLNPYVYYKTNYPYAQYCSYVNNSPNLPVLYDSPVPKCKLDSDSIVIYVYNTGNMMNERALYNLFKRFGSITSVFVPRAYQSNLSKNFAFIAFKDIKCAQNAIDEMNGYILENRQLQVSFKKPKVHINQKKFESNGHVNGSKDQLSDELEKVNICDPEDENASDDKSANNSEIEVEELATASPKNCDDKLLADNQSQVT